MKKILFITHDTSLSGAPKSLLLYLEWIKENKQYQIDVVSLRTVPGLLERFKEVSNQFFDASCLSKKKNYSFANRIKHHLFKKEYTSEYEDLIHELVSNKYDLVVANTIIAIPLALELKKCSGQVQLAVYIHELETVIREFSSTITEDLKEFACIVAASELVKSNLVDNFNIEQQRISVVYETTEVSTFPKKVEDKNDSNVFNVVMVGGAYWRKGDDIFVLIASYVLNQLKLTSVHFYWIGAISEERHRVNNADIKKLGIIDNVHFVGEVNDPTNMLHGMDLFILTSREDPFPLAALEAGLMGLPIICFDQGTGIKEIINHTNGRVIPYLDIQKMANIISVYYSEKEVVRSLKDERIESFLMYTPEINSPKLDEVLTKCFKK
jgi:glycosyltransferase involved in cell wall biosynthesis